MTAHHQEPPTMTSDEVIERVADWLNAFKADPFATGGDKASALLELVGTLAKPRPVESNAERVADALAAEIHRVRDQIGATEQQRAAFAYAEAAMRSELPSLLAALPPAGVEEWQPIESAPDDEIVLVWDYGSTQIAIRSNGKWLSQWNGVPGPVTPTFWRPLPLAPEGTAV